MPDAGCRVAVESIACNPPGNRAGFGAQPLPLDEVPQAHLRPEAPGHKGQERQERRGEETRGHNRMVGTSAPASPA